MKITAAKKNGPLIVIADMFSRRTRASSKNLSKMMTAMWDPRFLRIWATLIILASVSVAAAALPPAMVRMRSTGLIKTLGVGVYWDSKCTIVVSSIDWGLLEPGSVKTITVYVRNDGNAPVVLSLQTEDWSPEGASNYMSLSWNYNGQQIDANSTVPVTLSLSISSSIRGITSFSFTIIISATG